MPRLLCALALTLALLAAGCGDDGEAELPAALQPADPAYAARASAICARALAETRRLGEEASRPRGSSDPLKLTTEQLIKPGIAIRERLADRLRGLPEPQRGGAAVAAYLELFDPLETLTRLRLQVGREGDLDEARRFEILMQELADEQQAAAEAAGSTSAPPTSSAPPSPPRRRTDVPAARHRLFPLADGVRGIAAISIVVVHVWLFTGGFGGFGDNLGNRAVVRLDGMVSIFFVLSAFLLYRPMIAHRNGGPAAPRTGDYARRRFLRIYPAYWLALTVLAIFPGLFGVFSSHWPAFYSLAVSSTRSSTAPSARRPPTFAAACPSPGP